jgi:nucleotide-binding universal stress UspA family protein
MKILVGYEESKVAEEALKLGVKRARIFNADIFILTALEQSHDLKKDDILAVEDKLENLITTHRINDLYCETQVSVNYLTPGENLVEFARNNNIDEIVIGIKRRSKVGKLIFGSNAQYVILSAPCPVVTVK